MNSNFDEIALKDVINMKRDNFRISIRRKFTQDLLT